MTTNRASSDRLAAMPIQRALAMLRVALAFVPAKVKYGVFDATTHEMLTVEETQRLLDDARSWIARNTQ